MRREMKRPGGRAGLRDGCLAIGLMIDRDAVVVNLRYCIDTTPKWPVCEGDLTKDGGLQHFVPFAHSPPPESQEELLSCWSLDTAEASSG
jgi:hypothetical protein